MVRLDRRVDSWVELVTGLLRQPMTTYPHRRLVEHLAGTFDAEPSWNWLDPDGSFGFELLHPRSNWPPPDEMEYWRSCAMQRHPLVRWFAATGRWDAQTIGRVPLAVADRRDRDIVREQLRPVGLDEQLAIPYRFSQGSQRVFVIARTGRDFSDADVEVARRVQPLLVLLDRQIGALRAAPLPAAVEQTATLTVREQAVVALLAQGYTAGAIAHRLGSSPRTVHKHLEHIYRKLGVRDRLTAVQHAQLRGILGV